MKLSFNGEYGYEGAHARQMYAEEHLANLYHWADIIGRSFPSTEQKEAMVLAAYPNLRGDPRHDRSAR